MRAAAADTVCAACISTTNYFTADEYHVVWNFFSIERHFENVYFKIVKQFIKMFHLLIDQQRYVRAKRLLNKRRSRWDIITWFDILPGLFEVFSKGIGNASNLAVRYCGIKLFGFGVMSIASRRGYIYSRSVDYNAVAISFCKLGLIFWKETETYFSQCLLSLRSVIY